MATTSFIVALAQRGHSGGPTLRAVCCSGMTHGPSTRLLCLPSYTQRGQGWLVAGYRTLWCSSDGASGAGHRSVNATDRRQDIVSAGALAVVKLLRGSASVDGGCCFTTHTPSIWRNRRMALVSRRDLRGDKISLNSRTVVRYLPAPGAAEPPWPVVGVDCVVPGLLAVVVGPLFIAYAMAPTISTSTTMMPRMLPAPHVSRRTG